ncbi:DUF4974 domain-containing protein [Chitinophaga horti]|uniref:DUF4974 domain-containing protein n=1 Tax=Chitinophaga horti TaxID=2920382 RepID=A0ABY6J8E4_9BACT|nr:FecR domain-containing protein [Chitinophaga horti]UYQ94419.1 DUF4974 domain-containing protein [Chitinophaga horti]
MDKERISRLIARKLSGEASPTEIQELDAHLRAHPEDAYFLSILDDYWTMRTPPPAADDAEARFSHLLEMAGADEEAPQPRVRYLRRAIAIAAAVTGLLAGGWLYTRYSSQPPDTASAALIETVAKPGAKSRLLLPDGTVIWLNSGSRISYPSSFSDTSREVEIEGEAYFEVTKDPKRPFIVRTRDMQLQVLGTAFNVKCYPGDHKTEATLISGMVQVSRAGSQEAPVLLHPHEKVIISSNEDVTESKQETQRLIVQHLKKSIADTSLVETAWVYNKLVFDGEDFGEITAEMERWYNVTITIHDPSVARYRFHAKFENETITEVLSAMQLSSPFTFKINHNEVNIYK